MTSGPSVAAANTTSMFQVNCRAIIGSIAQIGVSSRDDAVLLFDLQGYGLAGGL